jgi:hypothetical protein
MSDPVVLSANIIDQVNAELLKGEKESLKAKVKNLIQKKNEHLKAINQIDIEIKKLLSDFDAGIL